MGLTPDVAAGTLIQSAWGNEIRNRTVQTFATQAELATWAAPNGAVAVTVDTGTQWQRIAGAWVSLQGRVRVERTTAQAIPNNVVTAVPFQEARYQAGSVMWTAGANTRLTVTVPGLYAAGASVRWAYAQFGYRQISVRRNGTDPLAIASANQVVQTGGGGTPVTDLTVATEVELNAGDYLELAAYQDSGANLSVSVAGGAKPNLWASWHAPLSAGVLTALPGPQPPEPEATPKQEDQP